MPRRPFTEEERERLSRSMRRAWARRRRNGTATKYQFVNGRSPQYQPGERHVSTVVIDRRVAAALRKAARSLSAR